MPPPWFSCVDKPQLAALAHTDSAADLKWLRSNGVDILISLTENPVRRRLCRRAIDWKWSSAADHACLRTGPLRLDVDSLPLFFQS